LSIKNQSYTIDLKLKVSKAIDNDHLSLQRAYLMFNIPTQSIITKWQQDFSNFGDDGLQLQPKSRPKSMTNSKHKKPKSEKPLTKEEE
jgi:transposase